jgi:hypothetical protein
VRVVTQASSSFTNIDLEGARLPRRSLREESGMDNELKRIEGIPVVGSLLVSATSAWLAWLDASNMFGARIGAADATVQEDAVARVLAERDALAPSSRPVGLQVAA